MVCISKLVLSSGSPLNPFRLSGGLSCWFLFGLSSVSFGLYWFWVSVRSARFELVLLFSRARVLSRAGFIYIILAYIIHLMPRISNELFIEIHVFFDNISFQPKLSPPRNKFIA